LPTFITYRINLIRIPIPNATVEHYIWYSLTLNHHVSYYNFCKLLILAFKKFKIPRTSFSIKFINSNWWTWWVRDANSNIHVLCLPNFLWNWVGTVCGNCFQPTVAKILNSSYVFGLDRRVLIKGNIIKVVQIFLTADFETLLSFYYVILLPQPPPLGKVKTPSQWKDDTPPPTHSYIFIFINVF